MLQMRCCCRRPLLLPQQGARRTSWQSCCIWDVTAPEVACFWGARVLHVPALRQRPSQHSYSLQDLQEEQPGADAPRLRIEVPAHEPQQEPSLEDQVRAHPWQVVQSIIPTEQSSGCAGWWATLVSVHGMLPRWLPRVGSRRSCWRGSAGRWPTCRRHAGSGTALHWPSAARPTCRCAPLQALTVAAANDLALRVRHSTIRGARMG